MTNTKTNEGFVIDLTDDTAKINSKPKHLHTEVTEYDGGYAFVIDITNIPLKNISISTSGKFLTVEAHNEIEEVNENNSKVIYSDFLNGTYFRSFLLKDPDFSTLKYDYLRDGTILIDVEKRGK